jgi:hypothetical protein
MLALASHMATPLVSPFLAALLVGTAPPPIAPRPIYTTPAGISMSGSGPPPSGLSPWPFDVASATAVTPAIAAPRPDRICCRGHRGHRSHAPLAERVT